MSSLSAELQELLGPIAYVTTKDSPADSLHYPCDRGILLTPESPWYTDGSCKGSSPIRGGWCTTHRQTESGWKMRKAQQSMGQALGGVVGDCQ